MLTEISKLSVVYFSGFLVCFVRLGAYAKRTEMDSFAIHSYASEVRLRSSIQVDRYTFQPCRIGDQLSAILRILRAGRYSDVLPFIVQRIVIVVIRFVRRPFSGHVENGKTLNVERKSFSVEVKSGFSSK